ncbi:MAG: hypothetical protein RIA64_10525 [Rhodospirillales bacterium]
MVEGLAASYVKGPFVDSPIDNVHAQGPLCDKTTKMALERGDHFGADHYAASVILTRP